MLDRCKSFDSLLWTWLIMLMKEWALAQYGTSIWLSPIASIGIPVVLHKNKSWRPATSFQLSSFLHYSKYSKMRWWDQLYVFSLFPIPWLKWKRFHAGYHRRVLLHVIITMHSPTITLAFLLLPNQLCYTNKLLHLWLYRELATR